MKIEGYKEGDTIQLLMMSSHIGAVMEEWQESDIESDIVVRRIKEKGCVEVETTDIKYAEHVVRWIPNVEVKIKKKENGKASV